jgi:methylase of polypeptide subunit release factors
MLKLDQSIVKDFGGKSGPTQEGVRALVESIRSSGDEGVLRSLQRWTDLFRKTCGQDWPRPTSRLDRLARHYGVSYDAAQPQVVLFALQTWYVLLIKLLVGQAIAKARSRELPLAGLRSRPASYLRTLVESISRGELFSVLSVTDPWCGKPFDWPLRTWTPNLEVAVLETAVCIARYDPGELIAYAAAGGDLLKPLYESLFPRAVRHALGEYYTPAWLAEHVLDQVGYQGQTNARLLDPTCGSGTFLLAALKRWRNNVLITLRRDVRPSMKSVEDTSDAMSQPPIVGFDLHPLAVASTRANYLLAIADLVAADVRIDVPVFARDAILDQSSDEAAFEFVVGNPPWIAWDNLPDDYREATKSHWQRYGLFSLSGNAGRHGGGKKDLSMLVLYAVADRYLAPAGRLGMVITQTLFQSKGAGDGFRRFRLGSEGEPLRVLRVDDMVDVSPFADAANWTSTVVLQKGEPTIYPVQYVKWSKCDASPQPPAVPGGTAEGQGGSACFLQTEMLASPIDACRPTSPWIVCRPNAAIDFSRLVGRAEYTAHLGANSGGANAVYWLEVQGRGADGVRIRNLIGKAKKRVDQVEMEIEPDLLYPLVRWCDVDRWSARPSAHLLLAQDPQTRNGLEEARLRRDYPRTFAYLQRFEEILTARAAYRRYQDRQPFYSMYNVGPYTLAAAKVIWRRMDRKIRAAVVETLDDPLLGLRPVIPQETCVLIACATSDEAHYLCALLNSSIVHELVSSHSVAGGKGFGTPSILDYVPLKSFDPGDSRHLELAGLSRRMHATVEMETSDGRELGEIDRLAGMVLGKQGVGFGRIS